VHGGFFFFGGGGENLKGRDHLENPGVEERIILRWIFRKFEGRGMDWLDVTRDRDKWRAHL
jgi:hypothetical protein